MAGSRAEIETRARAAGPIVAGLLGAALLLVGFAGAWRPAPQSAAAAAGAAEWPRVASPEAVGFSGTLLDAVRTRLTELATTGMMVVVGGEVLFEYGDLAQVSYVASVRKSILALLYGPQVEAGTIDLDATLAQLEVDDRQGLLEIERGATVRDLISARSGIYHPASNFGDHTDQAPPRGSVAPGSYFLYNNWDFNAAGGVFELLTGLDIHDALASDLAQPLGMQDFDRGAQQKSGDLERSRFPAYHMWLSTRDMARIGLLVLREGEWGGRQLVPRWWIREILAVSTPLEAMNPAELRDGELAYGLMWWVWDGPTASGEYRGAATAWGAFGQYITVLPEVDLVIAHKTAVPPYRDVAFPDYLDVVERVLATRCAPAC